MGWHELTGRRLRVGDEIGEVVHVDSYRVVLLTEGDDDKPRRIILDPGEPVDVEIPADEERRDAV
jgi:hypothetical protein